MIVVFIHSFFSRFVFSCPEEELTSTDRFMFVCERAHWYYLDFIRPKNENLPALELLPFITLCMFQ